MHNGCITPKTMKSPFVRKGLNILPALVTVTSNSMIIDLLIKRKTE